MTAEPAPAWLDRWLERWTAEQDAIAAQRRRDIAAARSLKRR